MKSCTKCKIEKDESEFGKDISRKDGLYVYCKKCKKLESKKYRLKHDIKIKKDSSKYRQDHNIDIKKSATKYREEHRKIINENNRNIYAKNIEKERARSRKDYINNLQDRKKYQEEYRKVNKELIKIRISNWQKNNKGKMNAKTARRRAKKLKASPNWGELNDFIIQEAYSLAILRTNLIGLQYEVDHIIPLQNKYICGLHVGINLQVITSIENKIKCNKLQEEIIDNQLNIS